MDPTVSVEIINKGTETWVTVVQIVASAAAVLFAGFFAFLAGYYATRASRDNARSDREFQTRRDMIEPVRDAIAKFLTAHHGTVAAISSHTIVYPTTSYFRDAQETLVAAAADVELSLTRLDDFDLASNVDRLTRSVKDVHGDLADAMESETGYGVDDDTLLASPLVKAWAVPQQVAWTGLRIEAAQIMRQLNKLLSDPTPMHELPPLTLPDLPTNPDGSGSDVDSRR
jgi:hypothetical protein